MTEKDYNPEQRNEKAMKKQMKAAQPKPEATKTPVKEENKPFEKVSKPESNKKKADENQTKESKKSEKKPEVKKPKKDYAVVNGISVPVSMKKSAAICRFIKYKSIKKAINEMEKVIQGKLAVPMKGEIPHRKGKMMSGRFPGKTAGYFVKMLKTLQANANVNEIIEPVIVEAYVNTASRPYGRFGAVKRKRTHIYLKAMGKEKRK